jgi:DNA-binding MarR family transcriptional regulator
MARHAPGDDREDTGAIFRTLHLLKRKLLKEYRYHYGGSDLHPSSARTLHLIAAHGRRTMSELHDLTAFERGSLTKIVDGLINLGLVERKRGEQDRRKVFVIPTPEGTAVDREIHGEIKQHVARVLEKLSPEDRARFFDAMRTLEDIVEKL